MAPRGLATRPTSDRVREALFMMLTPWDGLRVVDLFAGSGAMGIEALSRGARHVDFVERSAPALRALQRNLETLELTDRARIWRLPLPGAIERLEAPLREADVVLMDPPYGGEWASRTLERLGGSHRLSAGCRVVLEHHVKDDVPERAGCLARAGSRRYGETAVSWYTVVTEPSSEESRA